MRLNIGVVLAGGTGNRYGANVPKQYLMLNGKEVLSYSINTLKRSGVIDVILVVCDSIYQNRIKSDYGVEVCDGGNTRNKSVKKALEYIKINYDCCENIIILESARPLCRSKDVIACLEALDKYDSVITGQKIVDSLGCYQTHTCNREDYYLIQAPEAFKFNMLYDNFDENSILSATCQQMPGSISLYIYFGLRNNLKITYYGDINYIETNLTDELEE